MISFTRAALVVAHPDDETLWAGGLPLRYPGDWTVICCSIPRADPLRAWKFFDAAAVLGCKGRLLPFIEPHPDWPLTLTPLDLSGFDLIVTHNAAGEYGHRHHQDVHRFVADARGAASVLTFGFRPKGDGRMRLTLDADETERKLAALRRYDHVSPTDGMPKWQALLRRYGDLHGYDPGIETYDLAAA